MMEDGRRRPARSGVAWLPVGISGVLALAALVAGAMLVADPTGTTLGLSRSLLASTVFADYRLPGIALFLVVGVFGAVATVGLARRARWAWPVAVVYGLSVVGWITVQIGILGFVSALQPIVGLAALAVIVALAHPDLAETYRAHEGVRTIVRAREPN